MWDMVSRRDYQAAASACNEVQSQCTTVLPLIDSLPHPRYRILASMLPTAASFAKGQYPAHQLPGIRFIDLNCIREHSCSLRFACPVAIGEVWLRPLQNNASQPIQRVRLTFVSLGNILPCRAEWQSFLGPLSSRCDAVTKVAAAGLGQLIHRPVFLLRGWRGFRVCRENNQQYPNADAKYPHKLLVKKGLPCKGDSDSLVKCTRRAN